MSYRKTRRSKETLARMRAGKDAARMGGLADCGIVLQGKGDNMDTGKLIIAAEREISRILAKLESDTGMVLDSIGVNDIEVTTFSDDRPQWLRIVTLEMKRLPGTRWAK